jgi:eukaryotic-like serine/threonine-protein kinase
VSSEGEHDDTQASPGASLPPDSEADDSLLREIARAPDRATDPGLTAGTVVAGRFRLEHRLGEGGMGVVWQAVHAVTRKPVALKFLKRTGKDDARAVQRFLREARAACAVHHPSVVEVHDVLQLDDGAPVMVMELLAGETLAERLRREGPMSVPELARVMVHVCSAVGCAHALGIVHRDLKPENIFLANTPGGGREVKVLDFGIAKLTASEGDAAHTGATTGTGAILGTPYYMAPEQLFGEKDIDHRADLWALGIIFYEALSGQRPTLGDNVGQIYKIVMTDAIVPLQQRAPHLPEPVTALVGRMLSRERSARPADADAVLSVLSQYTNETFVGVAGPPVAPKRESVDTPGERNARNDAAFVDSDTARASTLDAAAALNRSGVEIPLPPSVPDRKARPWPAIALVGGASLLAIGGMVTWEVRREAPAVQAAASAQDGPAPPPAITTTAPAGVSAATTVPVLPDPSVATAPSTSASTSRPRGKRGPGQAAGGKDTAPRASTSTSTPPSPLASTSIPPAPNPKPPAQPVDPGSYQ